jgi:hypothetical protein
VTSESNERFEGGANLVKRVEASRGIKGVSADNESKVPMPNPSQSDTRIRLEDLPVLTSPEWLRRPLTGLAFWTAIALPFLYLPLLVTGLETQRMTTAFLLLLGLNVVTLVLGHSYRRD